VWTLYFQALHYSYRGLHDRAIQLLEKSIAHTPTLPELYMAKARNLKRAGDYIGAAAAMEAARALDGQDRFLNTKCATYRLRAGDIDEAQRLFGMFTKKDAPTPGNDLEDMQSLKYLLEDGEVRLRVGKLAMALKRFRAVDRVRHRDSVYAV
jgi:tetratricopeptide (TPR) repeat protein